MALAQLDQFVQRASQEELQAADELVGSRAEFAVFTNLRRRLQKGPSAFSQAGSSSNDGDRRAGLDWVIALARVEMGGILATFTSHPAPFDVVKPAKFDWAAYRELLLDGAQTHVWALVNDPEAIRLAKTVPDTKMLAYLRRLNVSRLFLRAGVQANSQQLGGAQAQEAVAQDSQLKKLRDTYSTTISTYLLAMNTRQSTTGTTKSSNLHVQACGIQLSREIPDLQAGTATSHTFGSP